MFNPQPLPALPLEASISHLYASTFTAVVRPLNA